MCVLPHARGLGFKLRRGCFPSGAKKEWGLSPKAKVRVLHTAQLDVTKNRFETYVKSKDLDLWHVITYGDFPHTEINPKTKKDEIVPSDKQSDDLKRRLADEVERYIWGLPDNIQGNVTSSSPTRLQVAVRMANSLMDQKYGNCKRVGHTTRDCKAPAATTNQRAHAANQKTTVTCYDCGRQGHYRREANKDSNVVTGTFLLNNCYASMLFDNGADRSFVSTTFSSLIGIVPNALDISYAVELADGRVVGSDIIYIGCTLNLLNHPFNIDLMPIELDSFDLIIDMDWLSKYHVVIVYDKKIVRIPYGDEVLTNQGDKKDGGSNSRLSIISYTKTQKYIQKGCHVFLARITKKKTDDKSKEKRLKDVSIVRDFPKVFLEDFPGLSPTRQVEF
uniref:Reverse transcriptase domain-containing protein n=1 Tax=Tanacetum cinerariifolium TaxID=118510 RepID=A0A6L2JSG5_TANCI|nr:reverse transcriptase domain-containing protein [Tanacetum cinerariifolium]